MAAQHPLSTLPLDDPAYAQLAALERQGCQAARVSAHRPYVVRDVRDAVVRADRQGRCLGDILGELRQRFVRDSAARIPPDIAPDLAAAVIESDRLSSRNDVRLGAMITFRGAALSRGDFRPLWRGVSDTDEGTPPAVGLVRLRGSWNGGERLTAVAEAFAQTSRRNDPSIRTRALRNTSGAVDFSEAYLNGQLGRLDLSFGRSADAWLGEDRESIALSANGPPLDRLLVGVRWRRGELKALVGATSDVTLEETLDSLQAGTGSLRFHRRLFGHVLTVKPTSGVEISFGETLLSSRTTGGFDLAYANPLMALITTQNDTGRIGSDTRDNLVLFGGVRANFGLARVGAELSVDDVQIDSKDRQNTADQLAWRLLASAPLPMIRPASIEVEYRKVNSFTYLRDFYTDVYQSYDHPLGSELGPDSDLLRGAAELWLDGNLRLSASVGRWRQGAQRIDQRPGRGPNQNAGLPFPTTSVDRPRVQQALLLGGGAELLSLRFPFAIRVELARIDNAHNRPEPAALYVRALLTGSYAFRYP